MRYWPVFSLVVNGLIGWAIWSMSQRFASKSDISALERTVTGLGGRVEMLEREISHLPTADALHDTNIHLERLSGQLAAAQADYRHVLGRQERLETGLIRHDQILSDAARR